MPSRVVKCSHGRGVEGHRVKIGMAPRKCRAPRKRKVVASQGQSRMRCTQVRPNKYAVRVETCAR
eukprot:4451454-Pleurochrysis_carterae.AAC.1